MHCLEEKAEQQNARVVFSVFCNCTSSHNSKTISANDQGVARVETLVSIVSVC